MIDATANAETVFSAALGLVMEVLRVRLGALGAVVLERLAG